MYDVPDVRPVSDFVVVTAVTGPWHVVCGPLVAL